ncbi:adhesion G-protein coupled receptor G5 isoform X3 [Loxodonta africana]|uniref:adhesion G-protein coupled receptor G5 isoform X3 n=1 Tax=Loxodonta africana TaxID=9785 RepID=UPI0030CE3DD6
MTFSFPVVTWTYLESQELSYTTIFGSLRRGVGRALDLESEPFESQLPTGLLENTKQTPSLGWHSVSFQSLGPIWEVRREPVLGGHLSTGDGSLCSPSPLPLPCDFPERDSRGFMETPELVGGNGDGGQPQRTQLQGTERTSCSEGQTLTCVFWKKGAGKHHWGAWSSEGCRTEQPSPAQVLCRCNHLSYFAVLMQLSPAPIPAELLPPLTYISLVGCSISIVASLLTILLHFQSRKQGDFVTCIHMNLHVSVLLLNVTFLLSPMLAMSPVPESACMVLAAILHYALLCSLTWMAIEGFNLYLLLVRVYNVYIHRYVLKLCVLGWGVPAVLVLLLLAVKSSVYGSLSISQENGTASQNISICWLLNPKVHSVLVMGYGGLTSLFNLVVLARVLQALRKLREREKAMGARACRDAITVLGLTVLLGTTWALAFFSFGIFLLPQLFLFTIFNSFYGFFLFLWFCTQRCRTEAEAEAEAGTEMDAFSSSQVVQ